MVFSSVLAESARPYLLTFDSTESSDFINAVFVNVSLIPLYMYVPWTLQIELDEVTIVFKFMHRATKG